ncbi:MAG: hypothetical protein ACR2HH_02080 [Chthoniobacterales bacterium]
MSDPRNAAHDKKVAQEKEHEPSKPVPAGNEETNSEAADAPKDGQAAVHHEQAVAVLSKLKEMEFHSRANIEVLAGLTLTIEDELKQKEFIDPIGELYGAQDAFQTKITALVTSYEAECDKLKPVA